MPRDPTYEWYLKDPEEDFGFTIVKEITEEECRVRVDFAGGWTPPYRPKYDGTPNPRPPEPYMRGQGVGGGPPQPLANKGTIEFMDTQSWFYRKGARYYELAAPDDFVPHPAP